LGPPLLLRPAAASVAGVEAVRAAGLAETGMRPAPAAPPVPRSGADGIGANSERVHGFSLGAADLGACEPGKKHYGRPFCAFLPVAQLPCVHASSDSFGA